MNPKDIRILVQSLVIVWGLVVTSRIRVAIYSSPPKRQSKSPSILGGVGWNWVEWVWRGYNIGYKKPILAISGKTGFS